MEKLHCHLTGVEKGWLSPADCHVQASTGDGLSCLSFKATCSFSYRRS